jgi:hypothetical protein
MKWQAVLGAPAQKSMIVGLLVVLLTAVAAGAALDESPRDDPNRRGLDDASYSPWPAENTITGEVYLATPESARTLSLQSLDGITHARIAVVAEAPFELRPQRASSSVCALGDCHEMPDFDIAFFRDHGGSSASVGERHYNVGPESGTVPKNAAFAHVYLRTAGLTPDNVHGFSFVYLQGDPGGNTLPSWP